MFVMYLSIVGNMYCGAPIRSACIERTLVVGDPAINFSMKRGIARGPYAGEAVKQDLEDRV